MRKLLIPLGWTLANIALQVSGFQSPKLAAVLVFGAAVSWGWWVLSHDRLVGWCQRRKRMSLFLAMLLGAALGGGLGAIWWFWQIRPQVREPANRPASLNNWKVDGTKLIRAAGASRGSRAAVLKIDTSYLAPFSKDYLFMMIARVQDNSVDAITDPRIEKSHAFAITGELRTIQIDLSEEFIQRADAADKRFGQVSIQFYCAVIPKHVRPAQISTLSDITTLGGKQLLSNPPAEIVVRPVVPKN